MLTRKVMILLVTIAALVILVPYSVPFLLAFVTAVMLEPIVIFFCKIMKCRRLPAVTATFLLVTFLIGTSGYMIGAKLIVEGVELSGKLPDYSARLFEVAEKYIWMWQEYYQSLPKETVTTISQALNGLKNSAIAATSGIASSIVGGVAAIPRLLIVFFLYIVSLFLISLDLPAIRAGFISMFTPSAKEKIELVSKELSRATVGFLYAQLILSILTYVLSFIGLLILDVKYAVVISFLIVVVDILPIFGTGSFLIPWSLYNFATGHPHLAVGLLVLYGVITIVRRTIEPKILGSSLGISALAALVSMYLGFQLFGFFGLILGPAIVIIFEALRKAGFLTFKIDF